MSVFMESPKVPLLIGLLAAVLLSACGPAPTMTGTTARAPKETAETPLTDSCPHTVVLLMDRSGSYAILPEALVQLSGLIRTRACPGGTWFVRWIATDSFSDREIVFTLTLPEVRRPCANPFDPRCRRAAQQDAAVLAATRNKAADLLRRQRPKRAVFTDYWGGLGKAALLLATSREGSVRLLIIAGDLADDAGRVAPLDIKGTVVLVMALQSGADVGRFSRRRAHWEETFRTAGAKAVLFGDPSQPLQQLWELGQRAARQPGSRSSP